MVKIKFYYRPNKHQGMNEGYLIAQITHDNKSYRVATNYSIYADDWDDKKNCLILSDRNSSRTDYLMELNDKIEGDKERLAFIVEGIESFNIRTALREFYGKKVRILLSVFIQEQVIKSIAQGQRRSAYAYRTVYNDVMVFNKNQDIYLDQITASFVKSYRLYQEEAGRMPNTICFYLRNLRAIFRKGIQEGKLSKYIGDPFLNVQTSVFREDPAKPKKLNSAFLRDIDLASEKISNLVNTDNVYLRSNRKNA